MTRDGGDDVAGPVVGVTTLARISEGTLWSCGINTFIRALWSARSEASAALKLSII